MVETYLTGPTTRSASLEPRPALRDLVGARNIVQPTRLLRLRIGLPLMTAGAALRAWGSPSLLPPFCCLPAG